MLEKLWSVKAALSASETKLIFLLNFPKGTSLLHLVVGASEEIASPSGCVPNFNPSTKTDRHIPHRGKLSGAWGYRPEELVELQNCLGRT